MIYSESEAILAALSGIAQVRRVTRSWPVGACDLPCIAIARAAQTPVDYRDGRAYLTVLEYYVRVFAADAASGDTWAKHPVTITGLPGLAATARRIC